MNAPVDVSFLFSFVVLSHSHFHRKRSSWIDISLESEKRWDGALSLWQVDGGQHEYYMRIGIWWFSLHFRFLRHETSPELAISVIVIIAVAAHKYAIFMCDVAGLAEWKKPFEKHVPPKKKTPGRHKFMAFVHPHKPWRSCFMINAEWKFLTT